MPCSEAAPATLLVLVRTAATKVPVEACVSPPVRVEMSTVPVLVALTNPASVSDPLFTTARVPPEAVTPAIVPIWFAVPSNDAEAAMPVLLVRTPAISVPPAPSVTLPAVVEISAVPVLPTLTSPASARDVPFFIFRLPALTLTALSVPMALLDAASVAPETALPVNVPTVNGPPGSAIEPRVSSASVCATPVRLNAPSTEMFFAVVVSAFALVTSVYCPSTSVPVEIPAISEPLTCICEEPFRLIATVVENGAISTVPPVATIVAPVTLVN